MRPSSRLVPLTATALAVLAPLAGAGAAPASAPLRAPAATQSALAAPPSVAFERFIIKLRPSGEAEELEGAPARLAALAMRHGLGLSGLHHVAFGIQVMQVQPPPGETAAETLARLRADAQVEYAEADQRRYPEATADDPLFPAQWYLQDTEPAAIDAVDAWDVTTGAPGLVIADLDTGVRFDHPDLRNASANRLLPGYNLISNALIANNGHGRGPDASDPGDWVSASDLKNPVFADCQVANSSWHGTRVAGVLGAISNNATGIAGLTWEGWVEPVRVLGKCGGYDSDIIAGMAWAAGNTVEGVPANPYPARIINMSLGAAGSCPASYQEVINELLAEGVLVVVSAGNSGGPVDAPANCSGVVAVAGVRELGTKVGYSNLGTQITLAAPTGNCINSGAGQPCLFSIVTTTNSGTTVPQVNTYTDQYNYNVGTSFAAPQVAGIAGLMLAVNGNLTASQLITRLMASAQPFPLSTDPSVPMCHVPASASDLQASECNCTGATCGAGMANARAAVLEALRPIAAIALPHGFTPGGAVSLDASGSAAACNASIVSYRWSVLAPAANPPHIYNAGSAKAGVMAPPASETYTLMLTVTDSYGRSDSAAVVVTPDSARTTAPAATAGDACLAPVLYDAAAGSDSGATTTAAAGGGGTFDVATLLALAVIGALAQRYRRRCAASSHERWARR